MSSAFNEPIGIYGMDPSIPPPPEENKEEEQSPRYPSYPYQRENCWICGWEHYVAHMVPEADHFLCDMCAALPPYSDELYEGLVKLQRLFRAYFAATAKPCGKCKKPSLKRTDFLKDCEPICEECLEDELDKTREQSCDYCAMSPCRCSDMYSGCSECGGQYECLCAEWREEEYQRRNRHYCGDEDCEGGCGVQRCGVCIDVCRCDRWY